MIDCFTTGIYTVAVGSGFSILGRVSEEDATRLQIGFTRGKVYFPIRNEDGNISEFVGYSDGQLKMPPQWIRTNNVVKLKRA